MLKILDEERPYVVIVQDKCFTLYNENRVLFEKLNDFAFETANEQGVRLCTVNIRPTMSQNFTDESVVVEFTIIGDSHTLQTFSDDFYNLLFYYEETCSEHDKVLLQEYIFIQTQYE